jgi:hypothetical protein
MIQIGAAIENKLHFSLPFFCIRCVTYSLATLTLFALRLQIFIQKLDHCIEEIEQVLFVGKAVSFITRGSFAP